MIQAMSLLASSLTTFHVHFPGLGIENLKITRQAFTIFGFPIYWYGVIIATGVLLSLFLARKDALNYGLEGDDVLDTYLIMLPLGLIGARLYYVLFAWHQFKGNLLSVFDLRQGGLAFYGGVIGGLFGFYLVSRYKKKSFMNWVDFFVVYLPLSQAIGRWGNFINQEAFGTNTTLPWGMISEGTTAYLQTLKDPSLNPLQPVHPTFLYEFLGNMLIFFLLLYVRRQSRFHLETLAWYCMLYGILRFFVESVRTDALFIGNTNLRVSMLLSFVMFVTALAYLIYLYQRDKKNALSSYFQKDWFVFKRSEEMGEEMGEEIQ